MTNSPVLLLADIGGTNARFALAQNGQIDEPLVLATADFSSLGHALDFVLESFAAQVPQSVAVCAAGPPNKGTIDITNCHWQVNENELRNATKTQQVLLVNDFTALAAALPALTGKDLKACGGGPAHADHPSVVLGPGTGLGVSANIPGPAGETFISGEGGHVDLAAENAQEDAILVRLRKRFGHVSAERVLCGSGLQNLYWAMGKDDAPSPPAFEITNRALRGESRARECIEQFSLWLGAVAGDCALTFGARGGVYLAGGILPVWGELFPVHAFRQRFTAKGRYLEYLEHIPTHLITAPFPALLGLQRLALAKAQR